MNNEELIDHYTAGVLGNFYNAKDLKRNQYLENIEFVPFIEASHYYAVTVELRADKNNPLTRNFHITNSYTKNCFYRRMSDILNYCKAVDSEYLIHHSITYSANYVVFGLEFSVYIIDRGQPLFTKSYLFESILDKEQYKLSYHTLVDKTEVPETWIFTEEMICELKQ